MIALPIAKTVKQLRGFLGLAGYYRKFIYEYGIITKPLPTLLQTGWNAEAQKAFMAHKKALAKFSLLALPGFNQPFEFETDASSSGSGIGAVLIHKKECHLPISTKSWALDLSRTQPTRKN